MQTILVLGAAGMAGHVVYTYLRDTRKYNVIGTSNSNDIEGVTLKMDIFDSNTVVEVIKQVRPDVVINCIGMLIKASKEFPDKAIYGNSYFPHYLVRLGNEYKFKLIHISTDCVFSGKTGSYTEESFKDATDIYGMSKSLGEVVDSFNLTIRTSIIGQEIKKNGEGLFEWFMKQGIEITGYRSNYWSGVTTLELAKFIEWNLDKQFVGLLHLTNNKRISKYDLLQLFKEVFEKDIIINDEKDYVCDKSFISTNMALDYKVPTYKEMLLDQKAFMIKYQDIY